MNTTEWAAVICCRAKAVSNGKPDNHADRNDQERRQIAPQRAVLFQENQQPDAQYRGQDRPCRGQEERIKPTHGHPGGRERAAENEDAEHPTAPTWCD